MTPASIALTAGGSILSGISAKSQANATAGMYGYQSQISRLNQQLSLQNRDWALQAGGKAAVQYGMKARADAGAIKAGQSASGISLDSDSSVAVRDSQKLITRMDTETINTDTARKAYGFEVQAATAGAQSEMYDRAASDTKKAGNLSMMASLISGAGSVASKWTEAKSVGLLSSGKNTNPYATSYGDPNMAVG